MTANKPSDAIPEVMKRRIKELERDGYNKDFLRCFRNAIRSLDETDRYAHANKVQAEEIKALAARLAEALPIIRDLTRQITEFTEREGEADFYTGVAVEFLKKQSPCNHVWVKRLRGKDTCAICGVARAADSAPACNHFPGQSTCKWCGVVQPGRCCLDYPRCDCNSPPEPDDDWLCFQRPTQPKVTP